MSTNAAKPAKHPIQMPNDRRYTPLVPTTVTLQAYEVYKHIYGEQAALITGWCRGGFFVGELVAYLYAYPHPREDWRRLVKEALAGMEHMS